MSNYRESQQQSIVMHVRLLVCIVGWVEVQRDSNEHTPGLPMLCTVIASTLEHVYKVVYSFTLVYVCVYIR